MLEWHQKDLQAGKREDVNSEEGDYCRAMDVILAQVIVLWRRKHWQDKTQVEELKGQKNFQTGGIAGIFKKIKNTQHIHIYTRTDHWIVKS